MGMGADFEWNKKIAFTKKVPHDKHVTKKGRKRKRNTNML